jgi:hypothetical protein
LVQKAIAVENIETIIIENSQKKHLDPWEDEYFLHYMVNEKHEDGSSKTQVKRIEKHAQHFKLVKNRLFYRRDIKNDFYSLEYPRIAVRNSIAMDAHIIGHFQVQTTYERIKDKF